MSSLEECLFKNFAYILIVFFKLNYINSLYILDVVQLLSCDRLSVTPWIVACQATLSFTSIFYYKNIRQSTHEHLTQMQPELNIIIKHIKKNDSFDFLLVFDPRTIVELSAVLPFLLGCTVQLAESWFPDHGWISVKARNPNYQAIKEPPATLHRRNSLCKIIEEEKCAI